MWSASFESPVAETMASFAAWKKVVSMCLTFDMPGTHLLARGRTLDEGVEGRPFDEGDLLAHRPRSRQADDRAAKCMEPRFVPGETAARA